MINQGDIYWVDFGWKIGSEPSFRRPGIIIQNNIFNKSKIATVVVCSITSNLKYAKAPGNILLSKGTANLPKDSVINISQISSVDKSMLLKKIGHLHSDKFLDVLAGIQKLINPME